MDKINKVSLETRKALSLAAKKYRQMLRTQQRTKAGTSATSIPIRGIQTEEQAQEALRRFSYFKKPSDFKEVTLTTGVSISKGDLQFFKDTQSIIVKKEQAKQRREKRKIKPSSTIQEIIAAKEAIETSKAVVKQARQFKKEGPTPLTRKQLIASIQYASRKTLSFDVVGYQQLRENYIWKLKSIAVGAGHGGLSMEIEKKIRGLTLQQFADLEEQFEMLVYYRTVDNVQQVLRLADHFKLDPNNYQDTEVKTTDTPIITNKYKGV